MRTILAITLLGCACSRAPEPEARTGAYDLFREAAAETGLVFTHVNGATGQLHMPEIMGSGAAVLDVDNDGDLDVFLVQSKGASKLFRSELIPSGKLRFVDVTPASGIAYDGYGMGAATGDFDNDGFLDLLVTGWGKSALYRNTGKGSFVPVPLPHPQVWSTSASFFDYDRDDSLDLVILSYVNFSVAIHKKCQAPTGEPDYCTPRAYSPVSARLYHNEGGRFADVTSKSGLSSALGPGLGVVAVDANNDNWPDLFVANDAAANHLWINQRNGTFKEAGVESGIAYSEDGLAKAGMGVAAGDYDGDGSEDLFVVNLMREGSTLFRQEYHSLNRSAIFTDVSRASGLFSITLPFTGFGAGWLDFDNDSKLDLFIANGAVTLREEQRGEAQPYKEPNLIIHNSGSGRFVDVSNRAGKSFTSPGVSRGAAFGDLDNDGDTDILSTTNNGPARLLLNQSPQSNWIEIHVEGGQSIGARVTLVRPGMPPLIRRVHTDSSYCSASDRRVHFGLGDHSAIDSVEVTWADGKREVWRNLAAGRLHTVRRGSGQVR